MILSLIHLKLIFVAAKPNIHLDHLIVIILVNRNLTYFSGLQTIFFFF